MSIPGRDAAGQWHRLLTDEEGRVFVNTGASSQFAKIVLTAPAENEEIRKAWAGNYEYVCLAPLGSSLFDPVWDAVRVTWIDGRITRMQFQTGMTYADITNGWTF